MMALRFSNILLPFCLLAITLNGLQSELLAQADMDSVFVKRNVGEGAFEIGHLLHAKWCFQSTSSSRHNLFTLFRQNDKSS